jgi:hypothetical protein
MGIQNIGAANSLFLAARNQQVRRVKNTSDEDLQKAREFFYKAVKSCDKATERMMDKHIESVAESAKKQAEYRKKKAVVEKAREKADDTRELNESILIERINHRNMLEEIRLKNL